MSTSNSVAGIPLAARLGIFLNRGGLLRSDYAHI
jgi:hypothetical protein